MEHRPNGKPVVVVWPTENEHRAQVVVNVMCVCGDDNCYFQLAGTMERIRTNADGGLYNGQE
jgi:hypothetical protein